MSMSSFSSAAISILLRPSWQMRYEGSQRYPCCRCSPMTLLQAIRLSYISRRRRYGRPARHRGSTEDLCSTSGLSSARYDNVSRKRQSWCQLAKSIYVESIRFGRSTSYTNPGWTARWCGEDDIAHHCEYLDRPRDYSLSFDQR